MSVQLDNLIAILRDSAELIAEGNLCPQVCCAGVDCSDCAFNTASSVNSIVEELEVLQHAKA